MYTLTRRARTAGTKLKSVHTTSHANLHKFVKDANKENNMKDNRFNFGCVNRVCDPGSMTVAEFARTLRRIADFLEPIGNTTASEEADDESFKYLFVEAAAILWDNINEKKIHVRDECLLSGCIKGATGANEDFLPFLKIPNITFEQATELFMLQRLMKENEWRKPRELREDIEKFAKNRKQEIYTEIVEAGL